MPVEGTSNVDDFVRLGRTVQVHPGLLLIEQVCLLRDEQIEIVRRGLALRNPHRKILLPQAAASTSHCLALRRLGSMDA
jgi:hypothetical protein